MQTQTQVSWAHLGAVHGTGSVFVAFGACGGVTDGWCKEEAAAQLHMSTIPWAALHRKTAAAQRAPWDSQTDLQHVWHGVSKRRKSCVVYWKEKDRKSHSDQKRMYELHGLST